MFGVEYYKTCILTHLAYIANVKTSCSRWAESMTLNLAPFYDVSLPIDHISLTLDRETSFFKE